MKAPLNNSPKKQISNSEKITDEHLDFVCPMQWEGMAESEQGRFCDRCQKEVFDLRDCSTDEVIALQKKHGAICGFVRTRAMATASAAAVSLAGCSAPQYEANPANHPYSQAPQPHHGLPQGVAGGIRAFVPGCESQNHYGQAPKSPSAPPVDPAR